MMKGNKHTIGTLFAIGVGPGDPELLTLKAKRILAETRYVFAASSGRHGSSLALDIASAHIRNDANVELLSFPMTRQKDILKTAWNDNARRVLHILHRGNDAVFLTLGDPSLYSTFTYLNRYLLKLDPSIRTEIVPGITSFQAAAAALKLPLAEAEESLLIVSGAKGVEELREKISCGDNIIIMKAYKKYGQLVEFIREQGLSDRTTGARHVGLPQESLTRDIDSWDGQKPSYFTLLLIKKADGVKRMDG